MKASMTRFGNRRLSLFVCCLCLAVAYGTSMKFAIGALYLVGAQLYRVNSTGQNANDPWQFSTNTSTSHYFFPIDGGSGKNISFALNEGANTFTFTTSCGALGSNQFVGLNFFLNDTGVPFNPAPQSVVAGDLTTYTLDDSASAAAVTSAGVSILSYGTSGGLATMAFANGTSATSIDGRSVTVSTFTIDRIPNGTFTVVVGSPSNESSWTGEGNSMWSDTNNWVGAVPGSTNGTTNTDTAVFSQHAPNFPLAVDAGRNLQNLTFDTASVNALTVATVGGSPLVLTAGGTIQCMSTGVNRQTLNCPVVLEGDYVFSSNGVASSATLTFAGGIAPGTSGVTTLTLSGSNSGANTISGTLADSGTGQLAIAMHTDTHFRFPPRSRPAGAGTPATIRVHPCDPWLKINPAARSEDQPQRML